MVKFFAILTVLAAALAAQSVPSPKSPDPLTLLQQTAAKKSADWEALARGMEAKLGRMLPCDPRVRATIEQAGSASDARLMAMSQYLKAAIALAKADTEAARAAVSSENDGSKDLETERAEADQERVAIDAQISDLSDSVRRLPALDAAQKKLADVAALIREREHSMQQLGITRNALAAPLKELLTSYQARQAALENEQVALAVESTRWSDYYAARLARAQTECTIINQPARRKP